MGERSIPDPTARRGRDPLWSLGFAALASISFISSTSNQVLANATPLLLSANGGAANEAGLALAVFAIAAGSGRIVGGQLVDRVGGRAGALIGSLVFLGGSLVPILSTELGVLLVSRAAQGVGFALLGTSTAAMVAHTIPSSRRGEGFGYFGLAQSLSTAVGPSTAIVLAAVGGYTIIFVICGALLAIAFAISLTLPRGGSAATTTPQPFRWSDLIERRAGTAFVIQLLSTSAFAGYIGFLALYAERVDVANPEWFFIAAALAMAGGRVGLARLLDRCSVATVSLVLTVTGAGSFILIATVPQMWAFVLAGLCYGVSFSLLVPLVSVIALRNSSPERWGAATATYYLGADIGVALGGMLAGAVILAVGFPVYFALCAGLLVVAFLITVLTAR